MPCQGSVLVVDDELGPRESLRMILHPLYEVFTAENGAEALAYIEEKQFDLMTLDLKMPGISGMDVLREIRTKKVDLDVIIVSGYWTPKNAQEATGYGVCDVITKPFNVTDIVAKVGKCVEQKKFSRQAKDLIEEGKKLGVIQGDESNQNRLN